MTVVRRRWEGRWTVAWASRETFRAPFERSRGLPARMTVSSRALRRWATLGVTASRFRFLEPPPIQDREPASGAAAAKEVVVYRRTGALR